MTRTTNFIVPFLLGAVLSVTVICLLGAATPPQNKSHHSTQIVTIAGGLAWGLAVTDHEEDRLYFYKLPSKKDEGKVELKGNIDLSATGKDELPADFSLD